MIIICENCSTTYAVPANAIGASGRNVKCAKCHHIWFAKPRVEDLEIASAPAPKLEPIPSHSSLPVIVNTKIPLYLKLIPTFLFITLMLLITIFEQHKITNAMPFLHKLYDMVGLFDTEGLTISEYSLKHIPQDENYAIALNSKIKNNSSEVRHLPLIKISVQDENKQVVMLNVVNDGEIYLKPKEEYLYNPKIKVTTSDAKFITLSIGNKLEFMMNKE